MSAFLLILVVCLIARMFCIKSSIDIFLSMLVRMSIYVTYEELSLFCIKSIQQDKWRP